MNPPASPSLLEEALAHHQAGRLAEAEQRYKQILAQNPDHPDGLHLLGVLAHQVGRPDVAVELINKAIALQPNIPSFYNNLGNALKDQGKLDDAAVAYRSVLSLTPADAEAFNNLGVVLHCQGKLDDAALCCQHALVLKPAYFEAHFNLGNILRDQGKTDPAIACFLQALALRPDTDAHINLGGILQGRKKTDEAIAHYHSALTLNPASVEALNNLGILTFEQGQQEKAVAFYERALAFKPDSVETLNNLGVALKSTNEFDRAIACHRQALALKPDLAETFLNMGSVYQAQGNLDEAIGFFRRGLALKPDSAGMRGNLLLTMVYSASTSPQELAAAARAFGEGVADPLRRRTSFTRANPEKKLRIGYVSPDFRAHAVNYFFEPLLNHHDRQHFEIFAYSNTRREDAITARLKTGFDHWRNISALSDDAAADLIEADGIDILIDVAGHTADNRLMVFARKPAPVQVTWLGYPASTGMKAMDYRITDHFAEPVGLTEALNTETLWRLPEIFCCFQGQENGPAVIDHPPFEDNGYITFGCFNTFAKVTDLVLQTWSKIMAQVPDSRLLLEITGLEAPQFRAGVEARLLAAGLPPERVLLEPRKRSNQFVLYNRIDIALDPFPATGGTTSMDTVWMGVPFITLAGKHFVSRMGVTILSNVGLPELIAENTGDYIRLATALALDPQRLRALRHNLRDRTKASPLMNQPAFARHMEAAYRDMWRLWCKS